MLEYNILIVDDDRAVAASLKDALEIYHIYIASIANSGKEALEKSRNNRFDAFLVDQRMPEMTGVEFIKKLSAIEKDPLVYVITAEDDGAALAEAEKTAEEGRLPIRRYIPKPWSQSLFSVSLREDLREWDLKKKLLQSIDEHSARQTKIQDKLAKAQDKIAKLIKVEIAHLGALTAISAAKHEINNLNASISGNTGLLSFLIEDVTGTIDRKYLEDLVSIQGSLVELSKKLIESTDLMDSLFKTLTEPKTPSFLEDIIKHSLINISNEINLDKIDLVKTLEPDLKVPCHEKHLMFAFYHIIRNSLEAMPGGGRLVISTHSKNQHAIVKIEDSGSGIPQDILPDIFIPFFAQRKIYGGKGGCIAYKIIRFDHSGAIDVESHTSEMIASGKYPGKSQGTEVSVSLPI